MAIFWYSSESRKHCLCIIVERTYYKKFNSLDISTQQKLINARYILFPRKSLSSTEGFLWTTNIGYYTAVRGQLATVDVRSEIPNPTAYFRSNPHCLESAVLSWTVQSIYVPPMRINWSNPTHTCRWCFHFRVKLILGTTDVSGCTAKSALIECSDERSCEQPCNPTSRPSRILRYKNKQSKVVRHLFVVAEVVWERDGPGRFDNLPGPVL